jgi:hypothetical protein
MRQKIDIAEVESATKIRAKYLRALENEEFGLLPGNTFVKTFIRTYAEYLGLDAQLLIEEYRVEHEPRGDTELQPYVSPTSRRSQRERRGGGGGRSRPPRAPSGPPGPGTALLVLVGVVLVIFAILGIWGGSEEDGGGKQAATTPKARTEPKQERKERKPRPSTVRLRVAPSGETYVCVDRGAGTDVEFEGTLTAPRSFRGKRLRLNIGSPSSARVTVNGKRVRAVQGSNPLGFDFTPTRTRPLPLGQRPCA